MFNETFDFRDDNTYTMEYHLGGQHETISGRWTVLRQGTEQITIRLEPPEKKPHERIVSFYTDDQGDIIEISNDNGSLRGHYRRKEQRTES
jgi:hypothetical protein